MSCVDGLLADVARSVETELRPRLSGFLGGMLRGYLPQTWEFRTEEGTSYLSVGRDGATAVVKAPAAPVDVTVEIPHDALRTALATRQRTGAAPGSVRVTAHTAKGKTAFDFLRGRLGL